MTFSIVAHDPATGDRGIAVASKAPAVGSVVPYARADIGAIATQSSGDFAHGPRGVALLEQGLAPANVITALVTADDPLAAYRQLGVVDARGQAATFTGPSCDRLGRQSAALLVVRAGSPFGFDGRLVDPRVDDHPDPVRDLTRILNVWRPAVRLPPHTVRWHGYQQ